MSSREIRELREQIMQLRYSLEDQKSRSYLSILFYPITCLLYSLFNAIIDISFISILVYLMIYNNSWIYSFVLANILIYRNIGGLMLNINVSLIMTVIGIILLTHSFNRYSATTEFNFESYNSNHFQKYSCTDFDYNYNYTEKPNIDYIFNDSKFRAFKKNITNISLFYIDILELSFRNTTLYKNTIEFQQAFLEHFKDFQELMKAINDTVIYINDTLNYINKANPIELGKTMGTFFQKKTDNIKSAYNNIKIWGQFIDYVSNTLQNENKIK